jgi:dTDP-4-dehydrorhamnose reductase
VKILLLGKTGQLGWELERALAALGEVIAPGRSNVDLEDLEGLREALRVTRPDVIVNAAAYTTVDRAETDARRAGRVNFEAVDAIAEEAARRRAWLVHYSTDYVFDGTLARPYREDDAATPLSVYGRTKLAGEDAIRAHRGPHLVFRTSWLYGAHGANFAKTILRLAHEREELEIVADQHGAPTSAAFVADVTARALARIFDGGQRHDLAGTYHLAAAGDTTWYDYARYVLAQALEHGASLAAGPDRVRPIATGDYPLPAARPRNSRLDTARLRSTFDIDPPDWRVGVAQLVARLMAQERA